MFDISGLHDKCLSEVVVEDVRVGCGSGRVAIAAFIETNSLLCMLRMSALAVTEDRFCDGHQVSGEHDLQILLKFAAL